MARQNQQFDNLEQFIFYGEDWLIKEISDKEKVYFYDKSGKFLKKTSDFLRASAEGNFPVRWLYECQIAEKMIYLHKLEKQMMKWAKS